MRGTDVVSNCGNLHYSVCAIGNHSNRATATNSWEQWGIYYAILAYAIEPSFAHESRGRVAVQFRSLTAKSGERRYLKGCRGCCASVAVLLRFA